MILLLLRGRSLADVRAALEEASRRVAEWHAHQRGQAVLMFYFSGHSDGQVLEIAGGALPFAELRRSLVASAADVRVVIVDSCRSGALLALKGGTLGQAFDIRLADDLASTGEALVASSAADEAALESAEIGASFFSHHFISGLRGQPTCRATGSSRSRKPSSTPRRAPSGQHRIRSSAPSTRPTTTAWPDVASSC